MGRRIYPPLVRIGQGIAAYFFSPPGRRWPEGSDEGASFPHISTLAPHPAAADFSPAGRRNKGHPLAPTDDLRGGDIIFQLLSSHGDC